MVWNLRGRASRHGRGERGVTAVEYAIVASVVALFMVPLAAQMGTGFLREFDEQAAALDASGGTSPLEVPGSAAPPVVTPSSAPTSPATEAPDQVLLAAWGYNEYGQLGNGSTIDSNVPVAVDTSGVLAGKTVAAIAAGDGHTCVVADGKAYCWGENRHRELGSGLQQAVSLVPVAVDASGVLAGKTVTAISAGAYHTCVVADGKAYCWGLNSFGAVGNNSTILGDVPVAVNTSGVLSGKTVTAISAGNEHTCAVADGKAYCWGSNSFGQLGNGSTTKSLVPVAVNTSGVLSGKTVTAISAGYSHTCAVAGGKAYCWGWNLDGQLGKEVADDNFSRVPVAVDTSGVLSGKTVTAISAGWSRTCAVADGKAYCWGADAIESNFVPVAVNTSGALSGKTITAISATGGPTCVVADGKAYCWGNNYSGQLGNNSATDSSLPAAVDISGVLAGRTVNSISAGYEHVLALVSP